jgi:hypothetical protein
MNIFLAHTENNVPRKYKTFLIKKVREQKGFIFSWNEPTNGRQVAHTGGRKNKPCKQRSA